MARWDVKVEDPCPPTVTSPLEPLPSPSSVPSSTEALPALQERSPTPPPETEIKPLLAPATLDAVPPLDSSLTVGHKPITPQKGPRGKASIGAWNPPSPVVSKARGVRARLALSTSGVHEAPSRVEASVEAALPGEGSGEEKGESVSDPREEPREEKLEEEMLEGLEVDQVTLVGGQEASPEKKGVIGREESSRLEGPTLNLPQLNIPAPTTPASFADKCGEAREGEEERMIQNGEESTQKAEEKAPHLREPQGMPDVVPVEGGLGEERSLGGPERITEMLPQSETRTVSSGAPPGGMAAKVAALKAKLASEKAAREGEEGRESSYDAMKEVRERKEEAQRKEEKARSFPLQVKNDQESKEAESAPPNSEKRQAEPVIDATVAPAVVVGISASRDGALSASVVESTLPVSQPRGAGSKLGPGSQRGRRAASPMKTRRPHSKPEERGLTLSLTLSPMEGLALRAPGREGRRCNEHPPDYSNYASKMDAALSVPLSLLFPPPPF